MSHNTHDVQVWEVIPGSCVRRAYERCDPVTRAPTLECRRLPRRSCSPGPRRCPRSACRQVPWTFCTKVRHHYLYLYYQLILIIKYVILILSRCRDGLTAGWWRTLCPGRSPGPGVSVSVRRRSRRPGRCYIQNYLSIYFL